MLRILLVLLLMSTPAWAVVQWRNGSGANTLLGSSNAADIDTNTYNNIVSPLDSLLANYREGLNINYDSAAQVTVSSGSVTVSNSDGSVRLFLKNSGSTTVTWSDIDTGAESTGTYYVYAIAASASATAVTFKISANSTSPSGITYYKRIGSFVNDGSSNITNISNDNQYVGYVGTPSSKSSATTYQALTDGIVTDVYAFSTNSSALSVNGYTDSSSSPTTIVAGGNDTNSSNGRGTITFVVRKGDYWKITDNGSCSHTIYFTPMGS